MKTIPESISLPEGKKIYFASDLHLGVPDAEQSLLREKRFISWLTEIEKDCHTLFLLGDLFDFWFEYKQVVPRGFVRVLGKLATMHDNGIPIYFFTGNHDQWMKNYFETELNIPVIHHEVEIEINNKKFLLAHGDGLGPGDNGYKFMKKIFTSRVCRWMFARLHPNFAVWLGKKWSRNNRLINGKQQEEFMGEEQEWLILFCREKLNLPAAGRNKKINFFIFGHRHLKMDYPLNENSRYINLGDWIRYNSFAEFDGNNLELKVFNPK